MTSTWTPTPFDVRVLHALGDEAYVCAHPERPYDGLYTYDFRCRACWLHGKAVLLSGVNPTFPLVRHGGGFRHAESLSYCVERIAPFHEERAS